MPGRSSWIHIVLTAILLAGCGDDSSDGDDGNGSNCRGDCPTQAALNDPEAACAELGPGTAYCFDQVFGVPTAVNCPVDGGSALFACIRSSQSSETTCIIDTDTDPHTADCQ